MRVVWIIALILLIALLFVMAIYLFTGYWAYRLSLTRNGKIKRSIENKFDANLNEQGDEHYFDEGFQKIVIKSDDDLNLCGFFKDNNCNRLIILLHGYGGNHREMSNYAKIFERRGYDLLAIDHRCHGESEGDDLTMGTKESEDLSLWIFKMLEINPNYKIVLFGISMGASTVCITCGQHLPQNVVLAIEDCGYDSAYKQFLHVFNSKKFSLKFLFNIFYNYTKKSKNFDLKLADAAAKLKNSKIPILFIHGGDDKFVPTEMVYALSSQIPEQRRQIYIAPNAGHVESYAENPREYEGEINKFLSKYYM